MLPYDTNYINTNRIPGETMEDERWREVKSLRNYLLTQTDWTVGNDSPLPTSKIQEYKVYRQALRDVPQNNPNPFLVTWPEKPE